MSVLVDTSIWIEYFRNGKNFEKLEDLINENQIVINDLILAELTPFLRIQNQRKLITLLHQINKLVIVVDWDQLIEFQYKCLKRDINGIGIPDLLIAQNAAQNHCSIYSLDNHFILMSGVLEINLFGN